MRLCGGWLALVVVLVAGCGSGGSSSSSTEQRSTFRTDFKLTVEQFKQTAHDIGVAVEGASSQSDSQLASTFSGLATSWQTDLNHLKSLTPPPAAAGAFTTLTAAAARTEGDLQAIVAAARTHSGSAAREAGRKLVQDVLAAKGASRAIEQKLGIT
jgi:hypothetical protein